MSDSLPQNSSDPALPALRLTVIRWLQVLRDRLRRGEMSIGLGRNPDNRNGLPLDFPETVHPVWMVFQANSTRYSGSYRICLRYYPPTFQSPSRLWRIAWGNITLGTFEVPLSTFPVNADLVLEALAKSIHRRARSVLVSSLQTVVDINNPPAEYILETIRLTSQSRQDGGRVLTEWYWQQCLHEGNIQRCQNLVPYPGFSFCPLHAV
ncbi:hypothetical protein R3P38DRAFT_546531 [Favolaschia claudopus]|uniref:Uncharacterized protein n=1 Tax=Favolaschia claudopus TaxID=2862362 RepID=A0AAW0CIE2_9AGAR